MSVVLQPSYEELQAENLALKQALQASTKRETEARQETANYASELWWCYSVMLNKSLSGNMKTVLIKARDRWARAKVSGKLDEYGRARMFRDDMVEDTGLGASTVSRAVKEMGESGIMDVKHKHIPPGESSTGGPQKELWIGIPQQTEINPDNILLGEARNHGGTRRVCAECGSDKLELLRRVTCLNCGTVVEEKKRNLHKAEDPEDAIHHDPIYLEELHDLAEVPDVEPISEEETHQKLGTQFYQWFTSQTGCRLRINEENLIAIGVPTTVPDERYLTIEKKVKQYQDVIRAILEREQQHEQNH